MKSRKQAFDKNRKVLPTYYPSNLVHWLVESSSSESKAINDALFKNTDINNDYFSKEDARISFVQLRQLLLNAMRFTEDDNLGIEFGKQLSLTSMGMVGYAALASKTFDEAIRTISHYLYLKDPLIYVELVIEGDLAKLCFDEPADYGDIRHFMYMTIFSAFNEIFHFLLKTQHQLQGQLSYSKPSTLKQLSGTKDIILGFEADANEIVFPSSFLDQTLKTSDPMTAAAAREICESQLRLNQPITSVANQVRQQILKGTGENKFPRLEEVAKALCLSPRTLRRKLMQADTSYQAIVDEVRYQLAKKYLKRSQLSIADIAEHLGFNDPSNFGRAFRKWSGESPSKFRFSSTM